jgi:PAP2 superfamily
MWAFLIFIFYPCTPPRLLPEEIGFVDTVNLENAQSVWMSGDYVNKLAAMPSMHFGYAFCIGCVFIADSRVLQMVWVKIRRLSGRYHGLLRHFSHYSLGKGEISEEEERLRGRSWWVRALMFAFGIWYPVWILLTIVATANHYFLDAIVASFGVLLCYLCNRVLLSLLPAEDLLLWAWRLEKPVPTTGCSKHITIQ